MKKERRKFTIKIGTWNVQTMMEMGKLNLLLEELERYQMNITGLSEVRWSGEGKFKYGDYTIVYSGNVKGGSRGVAIVLDKYHAETMKSNNTISDRIVALKLQGRHHIINIIQVYAPTSAGTDEEIEQFYNDLQNVKDNIPRREVCMIIGDFNAKLGEGVDIDCGVGPYGLGVRNERGDMVASFCQTNDLVITNTLFNQPIRRRYTWISPGDRVRNQVDYILVDKRRRTAVLNSRSYPGADCDTDHILVSASVRFKAIKVQRKKSSPRYDTEKLQDPEIASIFELETNNKFSKLLEVWAEEDKVPEEIWKDMKNVFTEAAESTLGRKKCKKRKPFISEEVIELAKKKSEARKLNKENEYRHLKREIKSKIRRDKKNWLAEQCAKINEHNENRESRKLFEQIRSLKQSKFQSTNQCINRMDGTTLTEPTDILNRWHEYGNALFNDKSNSSNRVYNFDFSSEDREPNPLFSEIEMAVKDLKSRKSPGLDNIPGDLLKHSGESGLKAIHYLCCQIWKTGRWPAEWKTQEFVMLHKSGSVKDCNNYRTIALICHASKILLIVILNRMKQKIENELSDCQSGYRKNRGTTDMLFILQNIMDKVRSTKEELYITFIDYSKAFDSVTHEHLFETMDKMGFPRHLVALLSSLYTNQMGTIRWDSQNSDYFEITKGVRQGCILSPHLFNIYTEQVIRESDIEDMGLRIGGRNITNLRYADDTALVADNLTSMKRILHRVDTAGRVAGLKLNAKKTKVLHMANAGTDSSTENEIKIDKVPLETVKDFKYLGSIKADDASCSKDIKCRIGMAKRKMTELNNIWKDHSIPLNLKIKLLKCLVWPVMLYGCETWALKKEDENKIQTAEMWFFRRLLRVSWKDRRTNESILREIGERRSLLSVINQRKLTYLGHAIRNSSTDLMKTTFQGHTKAKRKKGRPPITLTSNITNLCNMKVHEVSHLCADRTRWRRKAKSVSWSTAPTIDHGDGDR